MASGWSRVVCMSLMRCRVGEKKAFARGLRAAWYSMLRSCALPCKDFLRGVQVYCGELGAAGRESGYFCFCTPLAKGFSMSGEALASMVSSCGSVAMGSRLVQTVLGLECRGCAHACKVNG